MYEALVKRLRAECTLHYSAVKDMREAANAIETLSKKYLTAEIDNTNLTGLLAEEHAKHLWTPVTERLPNKSGRYLTVLEENGIQHMYVAIFQNKFNLPAGKMSHWKVTHWMPLPEPPKEETE